MKNSISSITSKIFTRYISNDEGLYQTKTADINVLLNRVKLDKKKESRKKILFTASTAFGAVLFALVVF